MGDLAVGVTVVMAEDDHGRLLGRKPAKCRKQIRALCQHGGVGRRRRPAEPPDDGSDLAEVIAPSCRDGHVDGNAVQPGLGRCVRTPSAPTPKGTLERLLSAVFGGGAITQQTEQRPVDVRIRGPIEALEVRLGSRPVVGNGPLTLSLA